MATNLEQLRAQYPNLSDDAIADLAALTLQMSGNKATRKNFLGLVKQVAPNTPVPELDTEAAVSEAIGKEREAREALEKRLAERDFAAALEKQKAGAKDKYGLSDEDMAKMEEMMKKGDLPADYRFAPALFKQQTEPTTPTNYGTSGYGPLDIQGAVQEKGMEGLMDDPDNWARKTSHSMIEEMQRKGRATAF